MLIGHARRRGDGDALLWRREGEVLAMDRAGEVGRRNSALGPNVCVSGYGSIDGA